LYGLSDSPLPSTLILCLFDYSQEQLLFDGFAHLFPLALHHILYVLCILKTRSILTILKCLCSIIRIKPFQLKFYDFLGTTKDRGRLFIEGLDNNW
jgi:hypothetical protein